MIVTMSPKRFQHTTPSQASTVLHKVNSTVLSPRLSLSQLMCKSVDTLDLPTISPLRLYYSTPSQASTVLHIVGSTIFPPLSLPHELLCKSVDSPDLFATMSLLRLQQTTPSQASTVLHRFVSATLSPELLAYTEVHGLLALKTHLLGSSTSFLTYVRFFERGL